MSESKNILIVFAHPERHSLNGSILDATVTTLTSQGHKVTVSDLYRMGFNPILGAGDIKGNLKQPDKLDWLKEIVAAHDEDRVADDIRAEQHKLDAADLVIFQFPFFWFSPPAILKGWFDRVIHLGYAFQFPGSTFDNAHFKGKQALLSITTGTDQVAYCDKGLLGDLNIYLWPIQFGILHFLGFKVLAPHMVQGIRSIEAGEKALEDWRQRLHGIWDEKSLHFIHLDNFEGFSLKEDFVNKMDGVFGPTVGQHCGKPLPPGSQTISPTPNTD